MATLKTVPTQKKYGLQKRSAGVKKPPIKPSAFFSSHLDDELQEDDEEEENTTQQRGREGAKGGNVRRNNEIMSRANREIFQKSSSSVAVPDLATLTEEERMIYDYDGSYEAFKQVEKEKLNKAMGLFGKDEPVSDLMPHLSRLIR
jgi:hypothetical protein